MLYYKPTNTIYDNLKDAKTSLGHSLINRLIKEHSDDLVFIKKEFASYDYIKNIKRKL